NKQVLKGIIKNKKKNGDTYYVDATIVPIIDEKGKILEYVGLRKDITELILQKRQLEQLKDRQRIDELQLALKVDIQSCITKMPFASILLNADSNTVTAFNDSYKDLFFDEPSIDFFTLLVKQEGFLYANNAQDFFYEYDLCCESAQVQLAIEEQKREFYITMVKLQEGYIISFCEVV
ncbi:MAG: PAS domain-containing protein, partial [Campylobacterota bacterium]